MTDRRVTNPLDDTVIDAKAMEIIEENNKPIILKLEDGAVLRLKLDVADALRAPKKMGWRTDIYCKAQRYNYDFGSPPVHNQATTFYGIPSQAVGKCTIVISISRFHRVHYLTKHGWIILPPLLARQIIKKLQFTKCLLIKIGR